MSTPADKKADTQVDNVDDFAYADGKEQSSSKSFADSVNEAVSNMTKDAKGVYQLPSGLSEDVKVAAMSEKRFRDTQSELTKISQKNKALEAEKSVLTQKATSNVQITLTNEQAEELEELKFSDPEAWRKKLNTYEVNARKEHEKELEEEVAKVSTSTLEAEELERRKAVLDSFLADNKGFKLDDDIIANDIPPRIVKKLETGTITFEQFLDECLQYAKTGKVVKQDEASNLPNLSKVGGGSKPDANALKEDTITSYKNEVY